MPLHIRVKPVSFGVVALSVAALVCPGIAAAQSGPWDSTISNTHWYVPVPQLLAYTAPATSFANPIPTGDQTLWTLGTSVNGVFTGTSSATLTIGPLVTTSDSNIEGRVTPSGEIAMVFTPTTGGATTIGLGTMQTRDGVTAMEMQMITGTSLLVSHWAYMLPYDPANFTPPPPLPVPANSSPQWAWTGGTPWRIVSPALFGTAAPGTLVITDYKNGYFWGVGKGPAGSPKTYTLLGSITPEGRVLFNTLTDAQLMSLYGGIAGDASTAVMVLGSYDATAIFTGDLTSVSVVRPYGETAAAMNNRSAIGAAEALYAIASTPAGLFGPMAPTLDALNAISGAALSSALSQTLPVLNGAASQATANSQRVLQQIVVDRLEDIDAKGRAPTHAEPAHRHIWMRPFGTFMHQGSRSGAPGYQSDGGGVVAGVDGTVAPGLSLGAFFAYLNNRIDGSWSAVPGKLDVNSYLIGTYGTYDLGHAMSLDMRLDVGLNRNDTRRTIQFMGTTASSDYDSYSAHAGVGVRRTLAFGDKALLTPSLRLDYLQINADAYAESGAGALDLRVNSQLYQELMMTADLKVDYALTDSVALTMQGGVGYNLLDNDTRITATYAGGGSFATYGPDVSPWLFSAGAGLVGHSDNDMSLGIHYNIQASPTGYLNQTGSVVLKMRI
ncbi:autotransporter family protein [Chelatococcus asaccharovorans]|uniref:autotransporter family protein n=1 Tax=Chelatococcus asaccharovorans TaxID=28210 RepID=UPI00224C6652|nr:autotransporter outer membrane beta-barrel domain-containing protein [Chelatococcus asaccharovorans]CAH1650008.1 Outer membrane autotransporter protein [Chelatococcus asaccharovorans]CAH1686830.1 Outer membrane autotransporter protein [Chelatococcus asaccharovorans]